MLRNIRNFLRGTQNNNGQPLEQVIVESKDGQALKKPGFDQVNVASESNSFSSEEESAINPEDVEIEEIDDEKPLINKRNIKTQTIAKSNNSTVAAQAVIDTVLTDVVNSVKAKEQARQEEVRKEEARQALLQKKQRQDDADLATNMENPLRPIYEADKEERRAQKDYEQQILDNAEANFKRAEYGIEPKLTKNKTQTAANDDDAEPKPVKEKSLFSQTMSNIISNLYLFFKSITDGVKKLLRIKNKSQLAVEEFTLVDNHDMRDFGFGYVEYQKNDPAQSFIQAEKNKMLAAKDDIYANKTSINNYREMYDPSLLILSKKPAPVIEQPQLTVRQKISNFFRNLFTTKAAAQAKVNKADRIAERTVKSSEIMAKLQENSANELFGVKPKNTQIFDEPVSTVTKPQSVANVDVKAPQLFGLFEVPADQNFTNTKIDEFYKQEEVLAKKTPVAKI